MLLYIDYCRMECYDIKLTMLDSVAMKEYKNHKFLLTNETQFWIDFIMESIDSENVYDLDR